MSPRILSGFVLAALTFVAAFGLTKLEPSPEQLFALPEGDPLSQASELLDEATLGDDLIAIVVHDTSGEGLLRSGAVRELEELRSRLVRVPFFGAHRSVLDAPILADESGRLRAVRPLAPPPTDESGWARASEQIAADPFVGGRLVSLDERSTVFLAWLWRAPDDRDAAMARLAEFALKDTAFASSEVGLRVSRHLNEVRLGVLMGEVQRSEASELMARLRRDAESLPALDDLVAAWREDAKEPRKAALRAVRSLLESRRGELEGQGLRAEATGPDVLSEELAAGFTRSVGRILVTFALLAGLIPGLLSRSLRRALPSLLAPPAFFLLTLGLFGFWGAGLQPLTLVAALSSAWLGLGLGFGRSEGAGDDPLGTVLWCLPVVAALSMMLELGIGGPAGLSWLLVTVLGALALFEPRQVALQPATAPHRSVVFWGLAATAVGVVVLAGRGPGVDPGKFLGTELPAGWASERLAEDLGAMPPVFALADVRASGERALARPEVIRDLRDAYQSLAWDPALQSVVGWPDFVGRAAAALGESELEDVSSDAVEQLLMMFFRPDEMRALVSPNLDVAVGLARVPTGASSGLARLAERRAGAWVDGAKSSSGTDVLLAGDSVIMMVAGRRMTLRGGLGFLALIVLLVGLSGGGPSASPRLRFVERLGPAVSVVASLALGAAIAASIEGAVTPWAVLGLLTAGSLLSASWSWADRPAFLALAFGAVFAVVLLPSDVLALRALGAIWITSCLVGWLARAYTVQARAQDAGGDAAAESVIASNQDGSEEAPNPWTYAFRVAASVGMTGMLCCVAPMVLFMFGLMGGVYAISFADFFYAEDGSAGLGSWVLRGVALLVGVYGVWSYRRQQDACSIDPARKKRNLVLVFLMVVTLGLAAFLSLEKLSGWYFDRYIVPAQQQELGLQESSSGEG